MGSDGAVAGSPELRESYEACDAELRRHLVHVWTGSAVLPPAVRPYVHTVHAFASRTDRIADRGAPKDRMRRFARWRADTMADLRSGRSDHRLRRAFVDTVRRWDLDHALVAEHLDAMEAEAQAPPVFETFADQRRYLRGVTGTIAQLWAPMLGAEGPKALRLASVLGEACQLVDVFEDLPADLADGRCYLPREDLRGLGLGLADLARGERREELEELVGIQLARWHELLEQAVPVAGMVARECQPFLHAVLLGVQLQFDEATLQGARVLTEGIAPLTSTGAPCRRPAWPGAGPVPGHVAVILDGNRRWAEARGLPVDQGHRAGERAAMRLVIAALRLGIRHLSIYLFSTENWNRSREELAALFDALADCIARGIEWLHGLGVRVRWCGRRDRIDPSLASAIALLENMTSNNDVLTLTLCLDYGGRDELAAAARALAAEAAAGTLRPEKIGPADLARHLYVPELPDVDLLIRTSGEQRISNFLPWHLAYAELLFDPTPWPDFDLARLREAVAAYTGRERRFGGNLPSPARPVDPARTG
ncbi:polyprenyl diphosphate synthase [Kitasatospora sp. HPMI-4]|uniref:polyprenyl diphosphate synthase n=1 Tax=Kitasatospora sp. HPMI-4 TaxID=3448443 RepID=UPI003F1B5141